jgi:hypothetical protein
MVSPHPRAEPFRAALDIEASGELALRLGTARLGAVAVAALAVAALAAGCSAGRPAQSPATVATCYAFALQALDRHVTVTSVPPACRGLTHEQVNQAVDRAIRAAVGPHRKVVARRLAHREAAYLAYLIAVVPPRAPAPAVAVPASSPGGSPLRLAALAAWLVTVAAGAWLLAGWLARGGLHRRYTREAGVPRAVIAGHLVLALTGLGVWIAFLATGVPALAWVAVGVVLSVAGLGMATLAGGLPEWRQPSPQPSRAEPASAQPARGQASRARPASARSASTRPAGAQPPRTGPAGAPEPPARMTAIQMPTGKPLGLIALHGALASATILLVVLAAIGAH